MHKYENVFQWNLFFFFFFSLNRDFTETNIRSGQIREIMKTITQEESFGSCC